MAAQLLYQTQRGAGIVRVVTTVADAEHWLQRIKRPARLVDAKGQTIGGIYRVDPCDRAGHGGAKWGWWLDQGAV